jgi:3-oxoacyl-[acyl-carrier-protein] synthase III
MLKLLRTLFVLLFATALLWAAVVWHWQRTGQSVDARDVLLYLVVLPLVVIGGALALRWAWRRADVAQNARSAAAVAAGGASAGAAAAPPPTERRLTMPVLAVAAVVPGADNVAAALELAAAPPTLALDPQLRDADGLGVFTRRCADLQPAELPDAVRHLPGADAFARSVALGERCVDEILQAWPQADDADAANVADAVKPRAERPLLLLWGLPEATSAEQRGAIEQHLATGVARWRALTPGFAWQLELVPVRHGEALLLQAERRLVMAQRNGRDELLLVVAAQSLLDEREADRLDGAGRLFTAQRGQGVMLGEGGAALLLATAQAEDAAAQAHQSTTTASAAQLSMPRAPEPLLRLHRLSAQRRDKPIDDAGRVSADTLIEAVRQAIEVAQLPPEQIALVAADTDAQRNRVGELTQALQAVLPKIDFAEQCRRSGLVAGCTGVAAAPIALALAATHVQQRREPALLITQSDAHDRLAAVLSPLPEPAAPAPA